MSSDFYDDYKNAVEQIRKDVEAKATARARYKVQNDFNTELINEIANKTGHENLASTCFVDVELDSDYSLDVRVYNDWTVIEGLYSSNSSFHQSGGKWQSVTEHYGMSREDFWERKFNGEDGGNYGTVDSEWLADNFWDGVYYATNAWPRSDAEFLVVYKYHDVSAVSVIESYYDRYVNSNRFQKYIQKEINMMID